MRETFDKELVQLHVRFAEMGMLVNEAIFRTVKAFVDHDQELAKMVIQNDQAINRNPSMGIRLLGRRFESHARCDRGSM